ncbi:TadE/TadG family type IV pilus assembly protein [Bacillus kwashiorkori]|uniref:TadE/TadG family type IV pilus assembly protein n=1 Tax=Bacillus kwashiorkori TaxID=1522318 RepID=UPI00078387A4|nr:hypothetical protein [Bacillus kwashiorkori]
MEPGKLTKFKRDERGAFTLEASILFPMILIMSFCLIFFLIVLYQKVTTHHMATMIAEHISFTWSNSEKDIESGDFEYYTSDPEHPDGLYWYLTGNSALHEFQISLGPDNILTNKKINRINGWKNFGSEVEVEFENNILGTKIHVMVKDKIHAPKFLANMMGMETMQARVTEQINVPTEFIRVVDFTAYFSLRLIEMRRDMKNDANSAIAIFDKKGNKGKK